MSPMNCSDRKAFRVAGDSQYAMGDPGSAKKSSELATNRQETEGSRTASTVRGA